MRLESVQPDPVEPKPIPQMLTKKKNLVLACHIITAGADNLRRSLNVRIESDLGNKIMNIEMFCADKQVH